MREIIKKILKENNLREKTPEKYRHLLGKRVCVPDPRNKKEKICGIASFIGVNEFTKKFQVTVGRAPIWPVNPNQIEVIDEEPNS